MITSITVFAITLVAFLLVIAGMAVGVMMGRRAISGSCGGLANRTDQGESASCSLCSNPDAACRELGSSMQGTADKQSKTGGEENQKNTGC